MQFGNSKAKPAGETEKTSNPVWHEQLAASNHLSSKSSADSQSRHSSNREQLQSLVQQGKNLGIEDSFLWEFQKLNRKAFKLLDEGLFEEAELSLNTAEQILQQAASQRKNIHFSHIITLFHNQICRFQHSWHLQECTSYVEAVIYNLKCQTQKNQKQKTIPFSVEQAIELKGILAHYYLLFCAFNSQLKQHDTALIAAKRSNNLLRDYFKQLSTRLSTSTKMAQFKQNVEELKWISMSIGNLEKPALLQLTDNLLSLKRNKVIHSKYSFCELEQQFHDYTIAQLMQLEPMLQFTIIRENLLNKSNLLLKIFMFSISYFTMATQLRLLAKKALIEGLQLKQINQYKQSQCYHLMAIIILLYFVPFDTIYLQHLLQSFKLHYSIELSQSQSANRSCKSYQMVTQQIKQLFLEAERTQNDYCMKAKFSNQVSGMNSKLVIDKKQKIHWKNDILRDTYRQNIQKGKSLSTQSMLNPFTKQLRNKKSKSKKRQIKNACMTSVQSPNKLSFTNTPRRLSPKNSTKYQAEQLQKDFVQIQKVSKNKKSQIISEYFDSEITYKDGIKLQKFKNTKLNKQNKVTHIDINRIKASNNQDYRSRNKKTSKRQTLSKRKGENIKTVKSVSHLTKQSK